MADLHTDKLYGHIRSRFGKNKAGANGYQSSYFFRREQTIVLSLIKTSKDPVVDIACGSGLLALPLLDSGFNLIGLDFNLTACQDANCNGLPIIRGDAFRMPLPDNSVGQALNCQFLNQQTSAETKKFVMETARVLKPGGQLILAWRNGKSLLHRLASTIFHNIDRLKGRPQFPQYIHSLDDLKNYAKEAGLEVTYQTVTLPLLYPDRVKPGSIQASIVGASFLIVLEKPITIKAH